MTSLRERLDILQQDLTSDPIRISAYHDLPFAIFCYDPESEYTLREEARRLATRLENSGKKVTIISLAKLMWEGVKEKRDISYVIQTEEKFGFKRAETTVNNILSKLSHLHYLVRRLASLLLCGTVGRCYPGESSDALIQTNRCGRLDRQPYFVPGAQRKYGRPIPRSSGSLRTRRRPAFRPAAIFHPRTHAPLRSVA